MTCPTDAVFKSKEAAVQHAVSVGMRPGAYSDIRTRDIIVRDWIHNAGGRLFTFHWKRKCKDGQYREFWGYEIGA